jgi:hypothetical protein
MKKLFILGVLCLLCSISAISQSKKEWERVQAINTWNVYQQFINNYPDGKYTEDAKLRLAQLEKPSVNSQINESNQSPQSSQENKKNSQELTSKRNETKYQDPLYPGNPTPKWKTAFIEGQQQSGAIVIKKKHVYQNDRELSRMELKSLLLSIPESAIQYNKAKSNATIALVPMTIGSVLALYGSIVSLSSSIDDANSISNGNMQTTDPSKYTTPILAGCGLVLIGIPFIIASNSQIKKSISIYNSKITTGYNSTRKLELDLTSNGVGLVYKF